MLLAAGFTMNILACSLWTKNFWLLLSLLAYIVAPLPSIVVALVSQDDSFDRAPKDRQSFSAFFTGALITSGFALPIILLHVEKIVWGSLILAVCGGMLVYITIMAYLYFFHRKDDNDHW
eukprot:TRINITY_DN5849_c0_g1_i2.p1 TRINITY_DN5849_c0_g1~~TRINITY_DN5849_c0_g1_i2.p1  ORF type:complete len:120 (-),score=2.75 TRINITY_DN5849_c0_g1_i2:162-521(-)